MKVWILNHYASTPDQPLTSAFDLASGLVKRGHEVTIFASSFSHYKFKELRLRPGEKFRCEEYDGVRFVWIGTPPYSRNDWRRIVNMLSYAWRAFWVAKSLKEKPHLIIGVTVHPFAALAAYILAVLKRTPFIFEVRDLWPLTLIEFGRLSEHSPIAWAMSALEWFLCHRAAKIITTVPGGGEYFKERGVPRDKTVWIPNGLDLSRYSNMKRYDGNVSLPFTVMYVGGHVYAFALDVILRAAQLNNGSGGSGVQFVFVGGGQEKPNLIRLSQDLGVDNVEFRDVVPKNDLYKVMEQADAFVLCMRDRPRLYKYGVSFNKLCDYLACGRPVIFAGSPFYNPIADARAGIVIPPENPRELAAAIRMLADLNPEERVRMGQNGQQYVKEHHDINILTEKLESVLKSVAEVPEGRASNQTT